MAYALDIVRVNVNEVRSPLPSTLQRSGFLISIGGSILSPNQYQYCGQIQEVNNLLSGTGNSNELLNDANGFFNQNKGIGVYVLELGTDATPSLQIRTLKAFFDLNPGIFYSCVTPLGWDGTTEDQVESAQMVLKGSGYLANPTATVLPPSGGQAAIITPIVDLITGEITGYIVVDGSFGYEAPPEVVVSAPFIGGTQATAVAVLDGTGSIIEVTPVENGTLYSSVPNVVFSDPVSGDTATGVAVLNNLGQVDSITMIDNGDGYNGTPPTVTIDPPPSGVTATAVAILSYPLTTLISGMSSTVSKFYFFVKTTVETIANYVLLKAAFATVISPNAASTESLAASDMAVFLSASPAANNKLKGMNQRTLVGITPYPKGNDTNADINYMIGIYGNIADTGQQGGLPNVLNAQGFLMSAQQAGNWYGLDWFQITIAMALAAAIIQGAESNPPLLYNTSGIRTLVSVAQKVVDNAISFGCLKDGVISFIPYQEYVEANPGHYKLGVYNGLSAEIVGQNTFINITFNVTAYESFIPQNASQLIEARQRNKEKWGDPNTWNITPLQRKIIGLKEVS
jgi:hypothetical protein